MDCPIEIRVKVVPSEIIDACVELITVNALPLRAVEYPAFRKVLNPYLVALKTKGINLVIDRESIKFHIENKALEIKRLIKLQARKRAVCLMLDIASRYNRSVLGINIAYMYKGKIRVYTIGMHTLRFSSTAKNIVVVITNLLKEYEIELKQIVAVTTDNGANMIRSTALLERSYRDGKMSVEKEVGENVGAGDREFGSEDEEYIDEELFDDSYYDDLLTNVRSSFGACDYTYLIHGISCAAHCIQLVIKHALNKSTSIQLLLTKCRELVKKLRSPTFRSLLQSGGFNMAKLEVETRWGSMYSMVRILFLSNAQCLTMFSRSFYIFNY